MKKFGIIILVIVLIGIFVFGIKSLLDLYADKETQDLDDYLNDGWEIEAEYKYSGNISENELQVLEE